MTPDEAMTGALDAVGLVRESIMARAQTKADALDALVAWRKVDRVEWATVEWWDATGRLRDAADRLIEDGDGIRAAIRNAEEIVTGECLCSPFDACDRCGDEVTP